MSILPGNVSVRAILYVSLLPLLTSCGLSSRVGTTPPVGRQTSLTARALETPTPLQKHVMFFDGNHDGKVTPAETREGLLHLGVKPFTSLAGAVVIHATLPKSSENGAIIISRIARSMHGSDTGIYDAQGYFVQEAFDRMWTFDADRSGSLTSSELLSMREANRTDKSDKFGSLASRVEFGLLLRIAADTDAMENGQKVPALSRARLKAFYDGSLFYTLAEARERGEQMRPVDDMSL